MITLTCVKFLVLSFAFCDVTAAACLRSASFFCKVLLASSVWLATSHLAEVISVVRMATRAVSALK